MNTSLLATARQQVVDSPNITSDVSDLLLGLIDEKIPKSKPCHQSIRHSKQSIAICIGHSRGGDKGAVSVSGIYEEDFNKRVAVKVKENLDSLGISSIIVDEYKHSSYGAAMEWLSRYLDERNITLAIELHFNSYNSEALGYEYLYWHSSEKAKSLALALSETHKTIFPSALNRGVKPLNNKSRGALFCKKTKCPAVICEPFFGSNQSEVNKYMTDEGVVDLADLYAQAIHTYIK